MNSQTLSSARSKQKPKAACTNLQEFLQIANEIIDKDINDRPSGD